MEWKGAACAAPFFVLSSCRKKGKKAASAIDGMSEIRYYVKCDDSRSRRADETIDQTAERRNGMAMKHCPDCGEKYSDTYKNCPFCEEEAAFRKGKDGGRRKGGHRVSQKGPGILSPILIIAILVLGALLVYLLFGDAIGSKDRTPGASSSAAASSAPAVSVIEPDISGSSSQGAATSEEVPPVVDPVDPANLPETLKISNPDFTIYVGDAPVKLTASGGSGTYVWTSEDDGIASVDENGTVIAISAGTVNVYASDGAGKGTCIVRVKGDGVPNTGNVASGGSYVLKDSDITLPKGDTHTLQWKNSAAPASPVWSTGDSSIATVAGNGKVTAVGKGRTTVTASWDGGSSSCIIRVS